MLSLVLCIRTRSEALHQAASRSVAPKPPRPVHGFALTVCQDHEQCCTVDGDCLDHGYPVNVPVQTCALVEALVCLGTYESRQGRRQDIEYEVVPQKSEYDLVSVVWKGAQRELIGKRLCELYEERRSGDGITHGGSKGLRAVGGGKKEYGNMGFKATAAETLVR